MTTRCSSRTLAMMAGAILAFAVLFTLGASTAEAVCANVTVTNNTPCVVKLYFVCPGTTAIPVTVPANSAVVVPLPAGCTPQVVPIICGGRRPMPLGPSCFTNVSVAPGCCGTVCWDPVACTVIYTPTFGPCPC
jgi:hypothetical protein